MRIAILHDSIKCYSCHNYLVGHCRSCPLHSACACQIPYSQSLNYTYLHLSCHSSPRILTTINTSLSMLCVTGIIFGDICRHISDGCEPQGIITVGNRPNLGRDVANSRWLVKCTSLWDLALVINLTLNTFTGIPWPLWLESPLHLLSRSRWMASAISPRPYFRNSSVAYKDSGPLL